MKRDGTGSMARERKRLHVEKMLKRALLREQRAARLVVKWRTVLADLGREDLVSKQSLLWESVNEMAAEP